MGSLPIFYASSYIKNVANLRIDEFHRGHLENPVKELHINENVTTFAA